YFDVPWRQGADGNPVRMNLIHEVDLLHHFLGQVVEIAALGAAPVRDEGRIESGGAVLRFKSGAVATLAFADTTPSPWGFEAATGESPAIAKTAQDYLHVAGTEGAIGFPSLTLWRGAKDWSEAPLAEHRSVPANVPLVAQLEHFADVCRGATPRVSAADGRAAVDVILRIEDAIGTVGPRRLSVKEEV
ncbi:MAG: Gfo/Idh/MocA family oxidoreductase, partial [Pseudomonadota bacterium]